MLSNRRDSYGAIFLLTIFFLSTNATSFSQNKPGLSRFGNWIKEDPVSFFNNMDPSQLITIGTVGASVATISLSDGPTSDVLQRDYNTSLFLKAANNLGDKDIILPVSAAIFAGSLLTDNTKFQDAAFTSLESILFTHLAISTGKFLFGRSRPLEGDGPYDFDLVRLGDTSFPSGHAAAAFALVTPWVMYYPNVFTYSLLAIPAGTAVARVAKGKHWLSDVTAGAAIGFTIGYHLSKEHLKIHSHSVEMRPSVGIGHVGMALNFRFN